MIMDWKRRFPESIIELRYFIQAVCTLYISSRICLLVLNGWVDKTCINMRSQNKAFIMHIRQLNGYFYIGIAAVSIQKNFLLSTEI